MMINSRDIEAAGAGPARVTRRHLLRAATVGGVIVPLLTGCTLPMLDDQAGAEPVTGDRVLIEMTRRNRFTPGGVTIPVGATVVWYNAAPIRHTATCDPAITGDAVEVVLPAAAAPWSSGDLSNGQTWRYTFTTPGTYLYACRYHGQEGMIGTIAVIAG